MKSPRSFCTTYKIKIWTVPVSSLNFSHGLLQCISRQHLGDISVTRKQVCSEKCRPRVNPIGRSRTFVMMAWVLGLKPVKFIRMSLNLLGASWLCNGGNLSQPQAADRASKSSRTWLGWTKKQMYQVSFSSGVLPCFKASSSNHSLHSVVFSLRKRN